MVAIGDFNDVVWSDTSQRFKRIGGYLDPRIGRGTFVTFPAKFPWLAWPLNHLFLTPDFTLKEVRGFEEVGSDRLPIYSEICLISGQGSVRNEPAEDALPEDKSDATEVMQDYREDQFDEAR